MLINIQDDILKINQLGLLDLLLKDKTTKKNIMWATDAYNSFGEKYKKNQEITSKAITRSTDVIKTRARKALEHQEKRTKKRAEVFTPLWIVNKMNNYADEEWFGKKDIFNKDNKIEFPKDKNWKDYIASTRLEITCGEAPFLATRYDVETGEYIPIKDRIGILDRKLRVVNENAITEKEWIEWANKALQATYGYEFQGDNLLIARVNILLTMEEYIIDKFKRKPTIEEYKTFIKVIVWNIWQMDGLTGTVPFYERKEYVQITLFDEYSEEDELIQKACRIYDWTKRKSIEFISLKKER